MQDLILITTLVNSLGLAISLWLGIYIVLRSRRSQLSWLAALVLWLLSSYFFCNVVLNNYPGSPLLSWLRQLVVFVLPVWFHLTFLIHPVRPPGEASTSPNQRIMIAGVYGIALILFAVGVLPARPPVGLFALNQGQEVDIGTNGFTGQAANPIYPVFFGYLLLIGVLALRNVWYAWRETRFTALNPSMTLLLIVNALAFLAAIYTSFGSLFHLPLPTFPGEATYLLAVALLGYAVARHAALLEGRPIDSDFIYSMLVVGSLTTFYLVTMILLYVFGQISFLALVITLIGAVIANSLFDAVRSALDRLLYRRSFQQLRANLRALALEAGTGQTQSQHLQGTLDALCGAFDIAKAAIVIKQGDGFVVQATHNAYSIGTHFPSATMTSTELTTLFRPERRGLEGMSLLIPLYVQTTQIGAIVLSAKNNARPFTEIELELLEDLALQMASAIHALEQQEHNAQALNAALADFRDRERALELQFQALARARREEQVVNLGLEQERMVELVEDGLRRLYDYPYLGEQELAALRLIALHLQDSANRSATLIEKGKAASEVLIDAVNQLRPEGKEPGKQVVPPREWHAFFILHDAYVRGDPNRDIMNRLYISQGTFNRTRRHALRAVAKSLLQMEQDARSAWDRADAGLDAAERR